MADEKVERILRVLEMLTKEPDGLQLSTVSKEFGIPLSSCHNLLMSMRESEMLLLRERNGQRRFVLGPRTIQLSFRVVDTLQIRRLARPHLLELVEKIGFDAYIASRVGDDVVYLERYEGRHPVKVDIRLGEPVFLHATAVGKLFAALDAELRARLLSLRLHPVTAHTLTEPQKLRQELDRIAKSRVSVSDEEGMEGIVGVAVPINDAHGEITAALHVSGVSGQLTGIALTSVISALNESVRELEREIGYIGPSAVPDTSPTIVEARDGSTRAATPRRTRSTKL